MIHFRVARLNGLGTFVALSLAVARRKGTIASFYNGFVRPGETAVAITSLAAAAFKGVGHHRDLRVSGGLYLTVLWEKCSKL